MQQKILKKKIETSFALNYIKMERRKGQVKMIETTMVLLVLVFLFGMIMIFFVRFQTFELDRIANEIEEKRAESLLNRIVGMPELRCSLSFGSASEINCIDTYKLLAFSQLREQFEEDFVGLSEVKIERLYPTPKNNVECSFGNNYPNNCKEWELFKEGRSRISFDTFVTLCTQKEVGLYECEIGRLIVSVPLRE